jgi:putative glutamine amidotransferase
MRIGLSYQGQNDEYQQYPAAIERRARALGLQVDLLWIAGTDRQAQLDLLGTLDAVVLTGGTDVEPHRYGYVDTEGLCRAEPQRDAIEWALLERLAEQPLPMLAICRGAQLLNVFYGGSLLPDLKERNAAHRREEGRWREHDVAVEDGTILRGIAGGLRGAVNSSHHQAVDRLAGGFRVSARSDDGVIEAFERTGYARGPERFLLAVQWHPEAITPGAAMGDGVLDALLLAEH